MSHMGKKYTRTELKEIPIKLKEYIEENGVVPTSRELSKLGFPNAVTIKKYFGGYNKLIESLGYNPNLKYYSKKELIKILRDYYDKTGTVPLLQDFKSNRTYPDPKTYVDHFGTWTNALIQAGLRPNKINFEYDELVKTYLNDKKGKISSTTITSYARVISDLYQFLNSKGKEWNDLNAEIIVEYFDYLKKHGGFFKCNNYTKPNSPHALKVKARSITAFLTWVEKWAIRQGTPQIIKSAEIEEIKETLKSRNVVPRLPEIEPRSLTITEIEQIRNAIDNPLERNLFDIGLNLGLRASEYGNITMAMVVGKDGTRFEKKHYIEILGKGNKIRKVVLTEEMKVLIKKQLLLRKLHRVEHDRLFFSFGKMNKGKLGNNIHRIIKAINKKSGVDFTAHSLRHSMSVLFQESGIQQNIISQRLGHVGGITQRYSKAPISARYQLLQEKVGII